jgi:hypothetical protein
MWPFGCSNGVSLLLVWPGRKQILRRLKLPGILRDIGIILRTITEAVWEHTHNEEISFQQCVRACGGMCLQSDCSIAISGLRQQYEEAE